MIFNPTEFLRSETLGTKVIGITKSELVAKTQFLLLIKKKMFAFLPTTKFLQYRQQNLIVPPIKEFIHVQAFLDFTN